MCSTRGHSQTRLIDFHIHAQVCTGAGLGQTVEAHAPGGSAQHKAGKPVGVRLVASHPLMSRGKVAGPRSAKWSEFSPAAERGWQRTCLEQ